MRFFGLPYEGVDDFRRGASLAPAFVRFYMESIEDYSPHQEAWVRWEDLGDLYPPPEAKGKAFVGWALEKLRQVRPQPPFIALWGNHLITLPVCLYLREQVGDFAVLWLDAHLDMRRDYHGEPYSNATVARRLAEEGFQVIHLFWRSAFPEDERALESEIPDSIYISLDLDVLDPSVAPGVSNPEPGGLSFRELLEFLTKLKDKRVVAADIVEFNPLVDHRTGVVAALLLRELAVLLEKANKTEP